MSDASAGWSNTRLGNLCSLLNGLPFRPDEWSSQGTPIIRIQNLNGGDDFNRYDRHVPGEYLIEPGTLLFSWSGNRGTSFGPYRWPGPTGILNQHIFKVTPSAGVDGGWLYYGLGIARARAEQAAHGGSGLVHVRRGDLQAYEIPTPPLPEQRQIAAVLDTLDDAIRKTEQIIAKLKQVKQGLLHDLLTRGIDDNGELRDPERHPEQFKESALGRIPKAWEVAPCGEVFEVQLGKMMSPSALSGPDPRPYLRNQNVYWDRLDLGDVATMHFDEADMAKFRLRNGDLLACEGRFIGRCAIWRDEIPDCYYQKALHRLRARSQRASTEFMQLFMSFRFEHDRGFVEQMTHESTIPHLPLEKLVSLPILLPPRQEQDLIVASVESSTHRERHEAAALEKLNSLRQGLMEDLLTGRVRVTPLLENPSR